MREPYRTSLIRGVLVGALVGASGFFAAWATTDELKQLLSATFVPALTTWLGFLGWGAVDAQKQGGGV